MSAKNWVIDTAKEIQEHYPLTDDLIVAIFHKHCPFEPDTAYMKVPRCETCELWKEYGNAKGAGECSWFVTHVQTPYDFGCVNWKVR
jgi:hypothetical protein